MGEHYPRKGCSSPPSGVVIAPSWRADCCSVRGTQPLDRTEGTVMVGLIISLIIVGLIAGALARLLVPGRQDIGIPATIGLGIVGSSVGGFLGYLIFHKDSQNGFFQPSGIIGSVIGAIIVLLIWMRMENHRTVR